MTALPVTELFETIQGEATWTGTPAIFVRLQGCDVGCSWCLDPSARFLLGDFQTIAAGDVVPGMTMIGTRRKDVEAVGAYERGVVEDVVHRLAPKLRIIFDNGRETVVSENHRFVMHRAPGISPGRFKEAWKLQAGDVLRSYDPGHGMIMSGDYCRGYLAGAADGDGSFHNKSPTATGFIPRHFVLACHDRPIIDRMVLFAGMFGFSLTVGEHTSGGQFSPPERIPCVRLTVTEQVHSFEALVRADQHSHAWRVGYLAGMYDTDGSTCGGEIVSWSQTKPRSRARLLSVLRQMGLPHVEDECGKRIRLTGGMERLRPLLAQMRPAVARKIDPLWFQEHRQSGIATVMRVENAGIGSVVSIQTSLGTYVADGLPARNCDTKFSWPLNPQREITLAAMLAKETDSDNYAAVGVSTLVATIKSYRARHVVITGGEPCQYDLTPLTQALRYEAYRVQIETSGTEPVRADPDAWITVSPKWDMPGGKVVRPEVVMGASEIKLPIGRPSDIERFLRFWKEQRERYSTLVAPSVWLQPLSTSSKATALCIEAATQHGWRVSLQTHKFIGVR